jgi:serine/threonine protein kinase
MHSLPRIPGYELLQLLGSGPSSRVYVARDCTTDAPCAVKVLLPDWQDPGTALKLFQREARAGLSVRHPHLVRVLYAHVIRPPYFLVMELLPGESLRQRLQRDYRLDLPAALWVTRQTAEALAALHRAGFVHSDVKPENIRLVDDGTAKLIDLGFAHRHGENTSLLRDGLLLGTVNYLAPELCDFDQDATPSSDFFSLGVTLFEMLTGRLPYPPGSLRQTLHRHRSDPPEDIRQYAESLPSGLVALVEGLLAHRSGDRPRSGAVVQHLVTLEIATLRQRKSA